MCTSRPLTCVPPIFALLLLSGCNLTLPKQSETTGNSSDIWEEDSPGVTLISAGDDLDNGPTDDVDDAPVDLWDRIRGGYQLSLHQERPRVKRQLAWHANNPEHLRRVEKHARPYLYHVVESIQRRGMPMEIALLPVVESAYKPFAYSRGRAQGIWQFIPSTGNMFSLKQNWWYDGRRDILASTEAALDYLEMLAEQFDGDWELALAAYNAGASKVRRAIGKNRRLGKPLDYWSLDLPRETKQYVPRLLAVAIIVNNPTQYEVVLQPIANQPYFASVEIESQLDLALAAEMAGIEIDQLSLLNPGFNRWATDPEGPHLILLPTASVESFNKRFAELDPEKRISWSRYVIQPGDTLSGIALKQGTTVAVLQRSNGLRNSRIRSGRALLIPKSVGGKGEFSTVANTPGPRRMVGRGPRGSTKITHTVQPGDSLWEIARRYNVNHKALARWNGISLRETLRPGQKLVVWTARAAVINAGLKRNPSTDFDLRPQSS